MKSILAVLVVFFASFTPFSAAAADPKPIDRPRIAVGDWWEFQNEKGRVTMEVSAVSDQGFTVLNKRNNQLSEYTLAFNKVRGYQATSKEPVSYSPDNRNYVFPLYPGKTWRESVTSTLINPGTQVTYTVQGNVIAWEEMTVAGKTMEVLKIDYRHGDVASTCWYSPEAGNVVKCESAFPGQTFHVTAFGKAK